ncbi:MAG: ABC transporter permease [Acidobacteria bacterium]|nr:ABC transporter permease [Acidobacteriota bacterium]MCB9398125.1 ABC transporter permease [Acidobacteriota bacterium]
MKFESFVAMRYLRAKRKQAFIGVISLITFLGITVGVAALNLGLSVHNGMRQAFLTSLIGDTGILNIDDGRWERSGFDLSQVREMVGALEKIPSVENISYIRQEFCFLTTPTKRAAPAQLFGIVPDQEVKISPFLQTMQEGTWQNLQNEVDSRPALLLGVDLARRLGVHEGDILQLTFLRMANPSFLMQSAKLKQKTFVVGGIFQTGAREIDEYRAYLDIEVLFQQLNAAEVHTLQIKLEGVDLLDATKTVVRNLPEIPEYARVYDLRDANEGLLHALQLEKWGTTLIIGLIIIVAALNLVSALIMLVMEKHRDIGIFRAMGATRRMLVFIFVRQGMFLSVMGTLAGTVLGVLLALLADHYQWIQLDRNVYEVLRYLPFKIKLLEVFSVAAGSLAISLLSSLYPAFQAASLDPVEALRYE